MQIATYYSKAEIERSLGERFGFDYYDQDWDLVNANSDRISEFISYFLDTDRDDELVALFELIIASVDDLKSTKEQEEHLEQIRTKTLAKSELFMNTLVYWSSIGSGSKPEQLWSVTPLIRKLLNELTKVETFKIECDEVYCIKLADIEMIQLVEGKRLNFTFDELIKEILSSNKLQLNDKTTLEIDTFEDAFFWSIYNPSNQSLYKFEKEQYCAQIKKYET